MTSKWGQHGWKFLHYVTLSYPDVPSYTERGSFFNLFASLDDTLPCKKCRLDYKKYRLESNFVGPDCAILDNRTNLVYWLFKFHNHVNIRLSKPEYSWNTFQSEYISQTEQLCNNFDLTENTRPKNTNFYTYTLLLIVIVSIFTICMLPRRK